MTFAICFPGNPAPLLAQSESGVVTDGSSGVLVEGRSAANAGVDSRAAGSSDVLIGGKPALRQGDPADCGTVALSGSSSVFVNGRPLASSGTSVGSCPD